MSTNVLSLFVDWLCTLMLLSPHNTKNSMSNCWDTYVFAIPMSLTSRAQYSKGNKTNSSDKVVYRAVINEMRSNCRVKLLSEVKFPKDAKPKIYGLRGYTPTLQEHFQKLLILYFAYGHSIFSKDWQFRCNIENEYSPPPQFSGINPDSTEMFN